MPDKSVCVHCGKQVDAEKTWICNHCGKLFAGESAEERVRDNAERGRAAEAERLRAMADRPDEPETAVESRDIATTVGSVLTGSEEAGLDDPLTDVLRLAIGSAASGREIEGFEKPVEYQAFQGDDMRYGWTLEPGPSGRYHSLTLHRHSDGSWEVTADEAFDSLEEARRWAERRYRESSGASATT